MIERVLCLMHQSIHHRAYTVDTVLRCIVPPIHLDQCVCVEKNGQLTAWASWAWLAKDKADAFLTGDYKIQPGDWASGENLVIMDFIAPGGDARTLYREIRRTFESIPADILPGATWVRFAKHGRIGKMNNGKQ